VREYEEVQGEYERVASEYKGVPRGQTDELGFSAGVKRRCPIFETRGYYIYIIYTPNLGPIITPL
jgi:hypothetical protein